MLTSSTSRGTVYRIHGTNMPKTMGQKFLSGCLIRMEKLAPGLRAVQIKKAPRCGGAE